MIEPTASASPSARFGRARGAVAVVAALAALFAGGTLAAPLLEASGSPWGAVLRLLYGPICHQLPERSIAVAGAPLAVCARCTGLYLGGVAGLALSIALVGGAVRRLQPRWFALAVLPTLVDAVLPRVGLPQLAPVPRLLLAVGAGFVAALFLAIGLADLVRSRSKRSSKPLLHDAPRALEEADG